MGRGSRRCATLLTSFFLYLRDSTRFSFYKNAVLASFFLCNDDAKREPTWGSSYFEIKDVFLHAFIFFYLSLFTRGAINSLKLFRDRMQGEKPTSESSLFSPSSSRGKEINNLSNPLLFFKGKAYAVDDVRPFLLRIRELRSRWPDWTLRPDVDVKALYFLKNEVIGSILGFTIMSPKRRS